MKGESYFFGRKELVDKVGCFSIGKGYMMDIRINDPACQLKSLDTIISSDNVWLNVQNMEDPSLVNYDLNQSKLWRPFFTKSNMTKYFPGN